MKKLLAVALLAFSVPASAAWTGRFDKSLSLSVGTWQSLDSGDQALGAAKHVWTLAKDEQPLLNLGVFGGVTKPLFSADSPRVLLGENIAIPGSTLDWALGTDWGSKWVPALKTGIVIAHDWTRPRLLHLKPDFIGAGISYLVGGPS